ncbi:CAP-Gly domain-containing linker protein 1-like [Astatotilapia calliptera]|uniref:CAP-Gly domain-containing linker protein 1-like n=1 Tax=Astatotilapia calliptera TaxID=8154 RepID=UPI000E42A44D|nr:CAP-Gly domain-containing linker protein 1-like [Astatotilapia calliptera]
MAHQQDGLFPQSLLKAFSVLIFIILLKDVCNGQPQLIGPSQALVARAGDDVILPCHLEPAYDVSIKTLEWTRSSLDPRFVYVSRASQEIEKLKNPSFKGRTSLFVDELKYGNISLKISKVKFDDTGTYKCYIPEMEKEAFVELVVASDAATSPVISLSGIDKNRAGVVLQCESAGWYPEPELLWLDGEGNLLSAGPTETLRGPDDLYTVSSRVTVEKRHSNNITCRVQQKKISQSRETHRHVPEDFFEVPSSSPSVIIGLAVSLALCIMLLISSAAVLLCRMKKHKNNRSPEDQTDVGGAEVPLRGSSPKTRNKTSFWPIIWTSKLQDEQKRREEAEKNLQDIKEELQQEKETAAADLKTKLEDKNREMINSKLEKAEFIQKRMQTFPTLDSKLQLEKNTEIIDQLKQVKEASEKLKNQLENKNPEMSKSETELDEIIQRLMQTFPTLESKLSGNISQAQKEKQEMEREMEGLRNELDSTKQQLQQEKTAAEDLKKQLEEKNPELQLYGNISQAQKEKQKMEREMERLRNELDSTKQQLQQEKTAAEDLEEKNRELENKLKDEEKRDEETKEKVKKLQQEKQAAEKLKNQFKSKCHEMIKSEREKDEIVTKLMKTFPTLETKWKKNTDIIKQLVQVKQKAEDLKKQLQRQTHEWTEKTETIHQLQQLKQAAETLKIQLESKNQQMIKSEREKDEFIQKLMAIFPALDSKWKENTEIINQLQEVKETAEKLKQLEKKNQEVCVSIINILNLLTQLSV